MRRFSRSAWVSVILVVLAATGRRAAHAGDEPETRAGRTEEGLARLAFVALAAGDADTFVRTAAVRTEDLDDLLDELLTQAGELDAHRARDWIAGLKEARSRVEQDRTELGQAVTTVRQVKGLDWERAEYAGRYTPPSDAHGQEDDAADDPWIRFRVRAPDGLHVFAVLGRYARRRGWLAADLRYEGPLDPAPGHGVRITFALDLPPAQGSTPSDADVSQMVEDVLDVMRRRLERAGLPWFSAEAGEGATFVVRVREDADATALAKQLAAGGRRPDFRIRVVVKPTAGYTLPAPEDGEPPRLGPDGSPPWTGLEGFPPTEDGFRAFLASEVARWQRARANDATYVPSAPGFSVARKRGTTGESPDDFLLLEEPSQARWRFGGESFADPRLAFSEAGVPALTYHVRPAARANFAEWTEANLGLPIGMLLDDEVIVAPVLRARIEDAVQITLGWNGDAQRETQEIVTRLEAAFVPAPYHLVGIEHE